MSDYYVIDLSTQSPLEQAQAEMMMSGRRVDLDSLRRQLEEIRDAFTGITETRSGGDFALQSLEVDLTIGAEGQLWFIAKGSVEASLKLTFARTA